MDALAAVIWVSLMVALAYFAYDTSNVGRKD